MEITKTVGSIRPDGLKDYDLHLSSGEVVTAHRVGSKYSVGGTVDTLKNIKQLVLDGLRDLSQIETTDQSDEKPPQDEFRRLWAHACPAALLALRIDDRGPTDHERTTLDAWGYITPDGRVDTESAAVAVAGYDKSTKQT